jgi:uncharacterized repeat protein (TIGR01451 family)
MFIKTSEMIVTILVYVLLLASTSASAMQESGPIQLVSRAEVEVVETDAGGKQHIQRVAATEVIPGEDVIYTLTFENVGTESGSDIVIQNPIPAHTVYRPDSASGRNTRISFSIDGGKSFSPAGLLTVTEADGSERIATASEYTTIRWHYTKPLQPGEKSSVEFRVVLQ